MKLEGPYGTSSMKLNAYLPMDRLHALAAGRELPDRAQGTVLFADISGFTTLTEALARRFGPRRGAEELAVCLNRVYDALIDRVHDYGGSVISFAGDAITCWFDAARGPAAARAVACAEAQQRGMQGFEGLNLKVGVASGPARRLRVGDPGIHYLDTLAGATVARMAAAERLAGDGEIIADPTTVDALKAMPGLKKIREWRTDPKSAARFAVIEAAAGAVAPAPWPEVKPLSAETLRPWVLPALYERLLRGPGEYLTELRPAVALFLRFEGIDYDADPAAGAKLDAYLRWVQAVLARYEGTAVQLIVGDKGSYLMAAFGAPIAHEDDARRAVTAALTISGAVGHTPAELDFIKPAQIGISQGIVRTGAYGGTRRRTYGVLGDEVNVAARLMSHAAPAQVLVSGRVRRAAARAFVWETLAPLAVKGRAEPVSVHHPRAPAAGETRAAAAMVGRTAEQAMLNRRLEALEKGTGSLILIEGEAGIGKSRLVDEALWQARARGITVLVGAGDAMEQASAYHAWQSVFRQLFHTEKAAETVEAGLHHAEMRLSESQAEQVISGLRSRLPAQAPLAPLLNTVLPVALPDNEITAGLVGEVRALRMQQLLVELIAHEAARGPLLLIVEDAHWLDSASWELLVRLSRSVKPLLLVVATRPLGEPPPPDYVRLRERPDACHRVLDRLSPAQIEALLCERLGVSELPPAVAGFVHAKAEGHPFFSEELALALRDAGLIRIEAGTCRLAPGVKDLREVDFPDTIEGVIVGRIDRLPPPEQLTLKVASVIGRLFGYRLLCDVHPDETGRAHLWDELRDLERLDLTLLDVPEPERRYVFKHVITREVAYNLLAFAQRRALHRAIAEWYERSQAGRLAAYYPLLAHHWTRAEVWPKACRYHVLAGDAAARLHSYLEASRHYAEGLAALDAQPETDARARVDLLTKLVSVSFVVDPPDVNLERLAEASRILDRLKARTDQDRARLGRIQHWNGRFHFYRGASRAATTCLEQAMAEAQAIGDVTLWATAASMLGQVKAVQGRFGEAAALLAAALGPLEQHGEGSHWIRTQIFLGAVEAGRGDYQGGLASVRRGLKQALEMQDATAVSTCHLLSWVVHFQDRNLPGMREATRLALETAGQIGYGFYEYMGYSLRGWTKLLEGDLEGAGEDLTHSKALGEVFGIQPLLGDWFAAAGAELALRGGRIEEAIGLAEAVITRNAAEGRLFSRGLAERVWAEALAAAERPDWEGVEAHLAASLEALEGGNARLEAARVRALRSNLARRRRTPYCS